MTAPTPPESPPPAVLATGGVIVPPHLCEPLWRILRTNLDRHRADGHRIRPDVAQLLAVLRAAALDHVSAHGHTGRTSADIGASSPERDLISTEQLAARLDVSPRHARRLAAGHGIAPAARDAWRTEDATALEVARARR